MAKVYTAESVYEAQMVADLLRMAGIETRILNQILAGLAGQVPLGQSFPEIWVARREDRDRALGVLEEYKRKRRADPVGEVPCAACGEQNPANFELCWSCRAVLACPRLP